MDLVTQIGGKYHSRNRTLFPLKKKLEAINVTVTHPISKEYTVKTDTADALASAVFSHYDIAVNYYESIADSDFHTVSNCFEANEGYIGESAAREILYALLKNKPIVLLYEPRLKSNIDPMTREIIARHEKNLFVCNLLELTDEALKTYLKEIAATPVRYQLTSRERTLIRARVRSYFRNTIPSAEVV